MPVIEHGRRLRGRSGATFHTWRGGAGDQQQRHPADGTLPSHLAASPSSVAGPVADTSPVLPTRDARQLPQQGRRTWQSIEAVLMAGKRGQGRRRAPVDTGTPSPGNAEVRTTCMLQTRRRVEHQF